MKIRLTIEADAGSSGCDWVEVEKAVRQWAAGWTAALSGWRFAPGGSLAVSVDLRPEELPAAIRQLHCDVYDLRVNFTVSVH